MPSFMGCDMRHFMEHIRYHNFMDLLYFLMLKNACATLFCFFFVGKTRMMSCTSHISAKRSLKSNSYCGILGPIIIINCPRRGPFISPLSASQTPGYQNPGPHLFSLNASQIYGLFLALGNINLRAQ